MFTCAIKCSISPNKRLTENTDVQHFAIINAITVGASSNMQYRQLYFFFLRSEELFSCNEIPNYSQDSYYFCTSNSSQSWCLKIKNCHQNNSRVVISDASVIFWLKITREIHLLTTDFDQSSICFKTIYNNSLRQIILYYRNN